MNWLEHGRIQGGAIVLPKPLPLPEGTEVTIRIETIHDDKSSSGVSMGEFASLPFFGMWADRNDMADSAQWVHEERKQWQQRTQRQD